MVWVAAIFALTLGVVVAYKVIRRILYRIRLDNIGHVAHVKAENGSYLAYLEVTPIRVVPHMQIDVVVKWKHWLSKEWTEVHRKQVF